MYVIEAVRALTFNVVNCISARRRGGRVAECGGLLNRLGLFRFSRFNHLQSEDHYLVRANVLSFGCECSPLCSPPILTISTLRSPTLSTLARSFAPQFCNWKCRYAVLNIV